jgi:hypothetical protein
MDGPRQQQFHADQSPIRRRGNAAGQERRRQASTGQQPRGWLSPALSESHRTLDILAENGIQYVGNWVNDENGGRTVRHFR